MFCHQNSQVLYTNTQHFRNIIWDNNKCYTFIHILNLFCRLYFFLAIVGRCHFYRFLSFNHIVRTHLGRFTKERKKYREIDTYIIRIYKKGSRALCFLCWFLWYVDFVTFDFVCVLLALTKSRQTSLCFWLLLFMCFFYASFFFSFRYFFFL